jgi:hypothetical protein
MLCYECYTLTVCPSFSRLSGGSTQSDVLQSKEKKKKKGLLGKLKKLTKSRSIDDGVSDFRTGMHQVIMKMSDCYIIATEMS